MFTDISYRWFVCKGNAFFPTWLRKKKKTKNPQPKKNLKPNNDVTFCLWRMQDLRIRAGCSCPQPQHLAVASEMCSVGLVASSADWVPSARPRLGVPEQTGWEWSRQAAAPRHCSHAAVQGQGCTLNAGVSTHEGIDWLFLVPVKKTCALFQ